jgi:hypothetical protein
MHAQMDGWMDGWNNGWLKVERRDTVVVHISFNIPFH